MSSLLQKFSGANVLVVGDVMLDRYWSGGTDRISPEAPVPVVKIDNVYERLGGSGNVAANITALGAQAQLLALIGSDEAGASIGNLAKEMGIVGHFIEGVDSETPVKLRVISQQQQLIRLDFERHSASPDIEQRLHSLFKQLLPKVQAVVLSDYGKGTVIDPRSLILEAKSAGVPVIVDPKGDDFEKYKSAYLITPNMREFENVVGPCNNDATIEEKGNNLITALGLEALLVTRGEQGMSLIRRAKSMRTLAADSQEVYDVTGAGDTVCGVCAVSIAAGGDLDVAIELANTAAGIVVSKFGTATVSIEELGSARNTTTGKCLDKSTAAQVIQDKTKHGARIVMTNGCFDILHAGHVDYLKRAKELGDYLVVAVNSDSSVAKLKGQGRPINTLSNRLAVLEALESVDYLIPFDELTPLQLVEDMSPNILVKGGDYSLDEIVGADHVLKNGGRVEVLPFVEGLSTSSTLQKIEDATHGDDL